MRSKEEAEKLLLHFLNETTSQLYTEDTFQYGMAVGKIDALRWVLGYDTVQDIVQLLDFPAFELRLRQEEAAREERNRQAEEGPKTRQKGQ